MNNLDDMDLDHAMTHEPNSANLSTLEKKIKEKNQQLKKVSAPFITITSKYIMIGTAFKSILCSSTRKERSRRVLYCTGSENMEFRKVKEQMDFLKSKDEDIARQHQKLLENEEKHIQKLEKDIEKHKEEKRKLQAKIKDYFLPEIKKLQTLSAKLEKTNIMQKNQLKELKHELKEKIKTIERMIEEAKRDESLQNIRFLQDQNSVLQTQLFYTEKKEHIDALKRDKMSLSRQLKKEGKKAMKREEIISDLLERNSKLRQAFISSSIPPPTVVDHVVEKSFYDNVSNQLKLIQQQLDMDVGSREIIDAQNLEKVVDEVPITFPSSPPRFSEENEEITNSLQNESNRLLAKSNFLTNEFKEVNI
ncbi:hypothetical protein C9374_002028 [Naegleria lovaniensis]|uniref:Uncharacterized protein n=1 Tax=Naegleria lovaniensis TaxID=51637 RepID=A0AA88KLU3_NAELO|nr:uncharacterized protein C9374_002028 [Naegleria lovaniensis]KAG2386993.1 hypothetical protein C9374_002028 [Naegleria lovaniensis]